MSNAIFDSIVIDSPTATGFSANDGGGVYSNITLRNSVIQHTDDTGKSNSKIEVGGGGETKLRSYVLFQVNACTWVARTMLAISPTLPSIETIAGIPSKLPVAPKVFFELLVFCFAQY